MNLMTHCLSIATVIVAACVETVACAPATGGSQPGNSTTISPVRIYDPLGASSTEVDITRDRALPTGTVRLPIAAAWAKAQQAYVSLGIPLTTHVDAQHTLGNEGMNTRRAIAGK